MSLQGLVDDEVVEGKSGAGWRGGGAANREAADSAVHIVGNRAGGYADRRYDNPGHIGKVLGETYIYKNAGRRRAAGVDGDGAGRIRAADRDRAAAAQSRASRAANLRTVGHNVPGHAEITVQLQRRD